MSAWELRGNFVTLHSAAFVLFISEVYVILFTKVRAKIWRR